MTSRCCTHETWGTYHLSTNWDDHGKMVRVFPNQQTNWMKWLLPFAIPVISQNCFWLMRDWKLESLANVKEISAIQFPTKKRTTSAGSLQFLNGFSRKFLFHLTFNWNSQSFFLNGKHPMIPRVPHDFTHDSSIAASSSFVTLCGKSRFNENSVVAFFHCNAFSTRWKCVKEHFHCILKCLPCFSTEPKCIANPFQNHFKTLSMHFQTLTTHSMKQPAVWNHS